MERAILYYTTLLQLNNIHATKRDIELIAFTAVRGNISNYNVKNEFITTYNSSFQTISNIVSRHKKNLIFIKENGKIKVNPAIVLDFTKPLSIVLTLPQNEQNIAT